MTDIHQQDDPRDDHRDDTGQPDTAPARGSLLTAAAALALAAGAVPVALAAGASVPDAVLAAGSTFTATDATLTVITTRVRHTLRRRRIEHDESEESTW